MAGHMLEASIEVRVLAMRQDVMRSIMEKVLAKPPKPRCQCRTFEKHRNVVEALQSLPDEYLSHLSKLESVTFSLFTK